MIEKCWISRSNLCTFDWCNACGHGY